MKFTTSWDDGYKLDMKVAAMLDAHGVKGTFYLCPHKQHGKEMLSSADIKRITKNHELGAHTIKHSNLTLVPKGNIREEILNSKKWIEEQSGSECSMFCYPYGARNSEVETIVQEAGFIGARGTQQMQFHSDNPYHQNTSLQIAPFPRRKVRSRLFHYADPFGPLRVKMRSIHAYKIPLRECTNWLSFSKALFTYAHKTNQPFFHLWGHSHEIEKYNMWKDLEQFLAFVARHKDVSRVTNSNL